jgi:pSer/pThr/pTyr-binding forkhead associated (FHA) protein
MDVKLVVTKGKQAGQDVPVPGPKFFIGRAEDCHLRPHSDLISRHHCVILIENAQVSVRDFGSKNGTFVNGQKVTGEVELKSGDEFRVGQLEFEVQINVSIAGKKLSKVQSVQEAVVRTVEKPRPQKTTKDDMDVSDWLDDESPAANAETTAMEPTRTIRTKKVAGKSAEETDDEEPMEEGEEASQAASTRKDANADSRDAATNSLRKLFRRF